MPDADVTVQDTPLDVPPPSASAAMGLAPKAPSASGSAPSTAQIAPAPQAPKMSPEDQLYWTVRHAEGTDKGDGYVVYGGDPITPGPEHPGDAAKRYGPDGRETHAAGPGQWQADTWNGLKADFRARYGRDPIFNNNDDQKAMTWLNGAKVYPGGEDAMRRDLAAGKLNTAALAGQWEGFRSASLKGWASGISPTLQARADALQGEASRLRDEYHTDAQELMREAFSAPTGSKQRDDAIAKLREREREYGLKYEEIASHPPALKPVDAMANFGSAGTVIALLGGLFARRHITAALGAAGQAMQAINQNNYEKFQVSYKTWEQQSTTALNMVKLHNEQIRELIDDKKMAEDEKNARLRVMFESLGMTRQADAMALGVNERVFTDISAMERAQQSAAQSKLAMQYAVAAQLEAKHIADNMPPAEAHAQAMREAGLIPGAASDKPQTFTDPTKIDDKGNPTTYTMVPGKPETAKTLDGKTYAPGGLAKLGAGLPPELKAPETWEGMPDKPPPGVRQDIWDATINYVETGKMPSLGFAAGMRNLIMQAEPAARTALGLSPTEVAGEQAKYAGMRHAEIVLSGRTANLGLALNEAKRAVPLAIGASSKVNRTEWPTLNSLYEAALAGTGDVNVVRMVVGTNALINTYAQVASRTGASTDAARSEARAILDNAYSKNQYANATDYMMKEVLNAQHAPIDTQRDILEAFGAGRLKEAPVPKYYIGQVIDTPKGTVVIKGGTDFNDPSKLDAEPVEGAK